MRTPYFLIVGAAKSGTTSLSHYLNQHPQIEIVSNRLEHFGEYTNAMMPDLSQDEYLDLFSTIPNEKIAGEKSVSYLYSEQAAREIEQVNADMKILILLRNPIDRAYSDYWHQRRNSMESLSFADALNAEKERIKQGAPFEQHYAHYGLYAKGIQTYFSLFGREQCRVFLFENFIADPQKVCDECFSFLDVPPPQENIDWSAQNKGRMPSDNIIARVLFRLSRKRRVVKIVRSLIPIKIKTAITSWMNTPSGQQDYPEMDSSTRNRLRNFYRRDIQKLETFLDKDLSHWFEE